MGRRSSIPTTYLEPVEMVWAFSRDYDCRLATRIMIGDAGCVSMSCCQQLFRSSFPVWLKCMLPRYLFYLIAICMLDDGSSAKSFSSPCGWVKIDGTRLHPDLCSLLHRLDRPTSRGKLCWGMYLAHGPMQYPCFSVLFRQLLGAIHILTGPTDMILDCGGKSRGSLGM